MKRVAPYTKYGCPLANNIFIMMVTNTESKPHGQKRSQVLEFCSLGQSSHIVTRMHGCSTSILMSFGLQCHHTHETLHHGGP